MQAETNITIDDAWRLIGLNEFDQRFLPSDVAPSLKAIFGEDGYEVFAACCDACTWTANEAHTRSQWDATAAAEPQRIAEWLAYYDSGQDEREAALKTRQNAIIAKKSGHTAAENFFVNHGREPTAEELSERYRPAPCSAEEHLADFEKWRAKFLESREYICAQHPHVLDDTDQETRDWLLSDFDPASESDLPANDRWPNVVRINATIESAEWLRECAATWEKVAAVASAIEVEVKRTILGIQ